MGCKEFEIARTLSVPLEQFYVYESKSLTPHHGVRPQNCMRVHCYYDNRSLIYVYVSRDWIKKIGVDEEGRIVCIHVQI